MAGAATFLTMSAPYRRARLLAFLHPSDDPMNRGLADAAVARRRRVAVASQGSGSARAGRSGASSRRRTPTSSSRSSARSSASSGASSSWPFSSRSAILGLQAARRAPDRYGMLVAAGVTVWVLGAGDRQHGRRRRPASHHGVAVAVRVVRWIGTVTTMAATGLLLNIARQGSPPRLTSPMSETFAVIAGGGTAGHVNPGLALAAELVARGHAADTIIWVGSERGLEATLVPPTGHPLHVLPGRGLQRRITLANVGALSGSLRRAACVRSAWCAASGRVWSSARRLRERPVRRSRPGRVGCRSW